MEPPCPRNEKTAGAIAGGPRLRGYVNSGGMTGCWPPSADRRTGERTRLHGRTHQPRGVLIVEQPPGPFVLVDRPGDPLHGAGQRRVWVLVRFLPCQPGDPLAPAVRHLPDIDQEARRRTLVVSGLDHEGPPLVPHL